MDTNLITIATAQIGGTENNMITEITQYYPPEHFKGQFHCPHCGVYAKQFWSHIEAREIWTVTNYLPSTVSSFCENLNGVWNLSKCEHCGNKMIWLSGVVIYPKQTFFCLPNKDLSDDIKKDYLEAANIFNDSPRSSAALLRLAIQKLCKELGEKGENINNDIASLVQKGLNPQIQKSLDILRVTGNNAVHPGEINIEENPELVKRLFGLINFIAEKMITEPKEINSFYEEIPEKDKENIEKRDSHN